MIRFMGYKITYSRMDRWDRRLGLILLIESPRIDD